MRVKQIGCSDETISGGDGRAGDWLIENALARFVVRGPYAALTELEEAGGTLIDAAAPGGEDLLLEYRPDGDRSTIEAFEAEDHALLALPGVTYRLAADGDALEILDASSGRLLGLPGAERTGATLRDGDRFLGFDGLASGDGAATVAGTTRLSLSLQGLWPDGDAVAGTADAEDVLTTLDGVPLVRLPVEDGSFEAVLPVGVEVTAEREGCRYDGLLLSACGSLDLRVADAEGEDLDAVVTDGSVAWRVWDGGRHVPVGPDPRVLWIWAGPSFTAAELAYSGSAEADVTLFREIAADRGVLAALAVEVAPDADSSATSVERVHLLAGEGVGYVVALADDEVPTFEADVHDAVLGVAASRAAGWLWSWPWSANAKKAAHGAVRWGGFGALDQLAISEGGESQARRNVVTRAWVEAALAEGTTWDPSPDALWLASLEDLPTYLGLLDAWVDVAPVAERTWLDVGDALNLPALDAAIVDGRTVAGTGPWLGIDTGWSVVGGTHRVDVTLDAARWMGVRSVSLWTSAGEDRRDVDGDAEQSFFVPDDTPWVVATAEGDHARPWGDGPAWAVSGPVWVGGP